MSSGVFASNEENDIVIPGGIRPGLLKLKAEKFGLSDEVNINIKEHVKLEVTLEGNKLKVKNVGNIKYKGPFTIVAGNLKKSKNIGLDVGDVKEINLDSMLPGGNHDVAVPLTGQSFDDVKIEKKPGVFSGFGGVTGNVVRNVEAPGRQGALAVLLLMIFGCALFLVAKKKKSKDLYNDLRSIGPSQNSFVNINKPVRKPIEYGKATQEDIEDFKKRMQAQFQAEEKQKSRDEFLRMQDKNIRDDKPRGGLFNMFN